MICRRRTLKKQIKSLPDLKRSLKLQQETQNSVNEEMLRENYNLYLLSDVKIDISAVNVILDQEMISFGTEITLTFRFFPKTMLIYSLWPVACSFCST